MTSTSARRSVIRVAPLSRETTASYVNRVAKRHGTTMPDFLHYLGMPLPGGTRTHHRTDSPYDTNELFFNISGRALLAEAVGVPEQTLRHALPAWLPGLRNVIAAPEPRALFKNAGIPSLSGCPHCTVHRTASTEPVRRYLRVTEVVCQRHRIWMLRRHTLHGEDFPVDYANLSRAPEVLAAHRRHVSLMRYRDADDAFRAAVAVTTHWWKARHPEEKIWHARARRIGQGKRSRLWYTLAGDAVTYPETVALMDLMFSAGTRAVRSEKVFEEIADRLRRPWLNERSLYPDNFITRFVHASHDRADKATQTRWEYHRSTYDYTPIELTALGYQPSLPNPKTQKPKAKPKKPFPPTAWDSKTKTVDLGWRQRGRPQEQIISEEAEMWRTLLSSP